MKLTMPVPGPGPGLNGDGVGTRHGCRQWPTERTLGKKVCDLTAALPESSLSQIRGFSS